MSARSPMSRGPAELYAVPDASSEDYRPRWRAYRVRFWTAILLMGLWPIVAVAAFELSRHSLHMPFSASAVIVGWLAVAATAVWRAGEFRCPRCRRRYGALGRGHLVHQVTRGLFTRVCQNCKLRKFESA